MPKQSHLSTTTHSISPLATGDLDAVIDLSLLAWEPVFASFECLLGSTTFQSLYRPHWREAQAAAVRDACLADSRESFVLTTEDGVVGFIVLTQDDHQSIGMIEMIAVHPAHQRRGHARALMHFGLQRFRDRGLALINVGTGGDRGHVPARALYEDLGFTGLPLVNYYLASE